MSPLTTVAYGSVNFPSLEIHVVNACPAIAARNIFILKTICSPNFELNTAADLNYIWDVIYNATWSELTRKRFTEDVMNLLLNLPHLPQNINVPEERFQNKLKDIFTGWLTMIKSLSVEHVLADRYIITLISLIC